MILGSPLRSELTLEVIVPWEMHEIPVKIRIDFGSDSAMWDAFSVSLLIQPNHYQD